MNELILEDERNKECFYVINYPEYEKDLCDLEMKSMFNYAPKNKYILSQNSVNPSRSPYIKEKVSIIYKEKNLDEIINKIKEDKLSYDKFKVVYIKAIENDSVTYNERLKAVCDVGFVITGYPDLHEPKILLGISKVEDNWIFGVYEKNNYEWHFHDDKPYSYSNGLSVRMSRAIVNIAVGNEVYLNIVDPCCGIGTVVIEALSLGVNIKGYEISNAIGTNAKKNLKFFGHEDVITIGSMHDIEERFDVAIVDIPYGLFSPTTLKDQVNIMKTARRIAKKIIIVTFENMDEHIISSGFEIKDTAIVTKGNFKRYIQVCE